MVYIAIIILTYLAKKLAASHLDADEICQNEESFQKWFRKFTTEYPEMLQFFPAELEPNYDASTDRDMENNDDATMDDIMNQTASDLTNSLTDASQ